MDDPRPHNPLLAEEPLADYLKRRERELVQQMAAIRGMLAPKEKQLAEVRQALKAIGVSQSYLDGLMPVFDPEQNIQDRPDSLSYRGILNESPLTQLVEGMTIKDMIVRALNDHFHGGATPSELRDYMLTAYGREIDRNSISPQLARLREEGLVQNSNALNESGKWQLSVRGSLVESANEVERRNVNALASSPRAKRWYGPKKD